MIWHDVSHLPKDLRCLKHQELLSVHHGCFRQACAVGHLSIIDQDFMTSWWIAKLRRNGSAKIAFSDIKNDYWSVLGTFALSVHYFCDKNDITYLIHHDASESR